MPQIIPFWIPSLYHPTIAFFLLDKFYLQIYLLLYFELIKTRDPEWDNLWHLVSIKSMDGNICPLTIISTTIFLCLYISISYSNLIYNLTNFEKSEADKFSTWTKFELFHKKGQWSIKCYNFISILNLNVSQSVKLYIIGKKKYYYKGFRFHFELKKKEDILHRIASLLHCILIVLY
jgi:hypothetical protein